PRVREEEQKGQKEFYPDLTIPVHTSLKTLGVIMTMRTECRSFGTAAVIALPDIFTFLSGTASADDLSLRASYQAGTDNPWSRPYVGVTVGLGTGEFVYNEGFSGGPTSSITLPGGGIRAGLRAGYDYAIGGN